jgi:hypothetical protein
VCPPVLAWQGLDKNITAAVNIHAAIENLLDALLSVFSASNQRKAGDQFFPTLVMKRFHMSL